MILKSLLQEIQYQGDLWLSLISRPQVQLQLGLIVFSWVLCRIITARLRSPMLRAARQVTPPRWQILPRRWYSKLPPRCSFSVVSALLLVVMLRLLWRGLEYADHVGGLVFWASRAASFWLLGRIAITAAYLRWRRGLVQQFDRQVLKPLFWVGLVAALWAQFGDISRFLATPVMDLFNDPLTVGELLTAFLGSYFVFALAPPLAHMLSWSYVHLFKLVGEARQTVSLVLRYLLTLVGLMFVISAIGVSPTVLAAITGGLSVGLGFGLKEILSNFVSGLWLLFEGAVKPGDVIELEGEACQVRNLGMRATTLWRDRDNAELVIPNQTFFTTAMTTFTRSDRLRRGALAVSVAYDQDPEKITALLAAIALSSPGILPSPAPRGLVIGFGDSAIDYQIRFWIDNPMNFASTRSDLARAIWRRFEQMGIEIPFPQRVLQWADPPRSLPPEP